MIRERFNKSKDIFQNILSNKTNYKYIIVALQLILTIFLLIIVFGTNKSKISELIFNNKLNLQSSIIFFLFICLSTIFCAYRWILIRKDIKLQNLNGGLILETSAIGNTVSSITPSGLLGDILKPILIKSYIPKSSLKKEVFAIGIDKTFGMFSLFLFISISIPILFFFNYVKLELFIFIFISLLLTTFFKSDLNLIINKKKKIINTINNKLKIFFKSQLFAEKGTDKYFGKIKILLLN